MRIGAIDLGSNSFHLLVADATSSGRLMQVVREKKVLRLGEVVATCGRIPDRAAEKAVVTVRQMRDRAISSGAQAVFGAATSAFRDAANGEEVLNRIERETGVHVRAIDGCEEGRLVFEAVQASMHFPEDPVVCLDLGGGSLEIVIGNQDEILWSTSLPLGVARLRAELSKSDPPGTRDRRRLSAHVARVIEADAAPALAFRPKLVVGAGGTVRAIGRMLTLQRDPAASLNGYPSVNGMVIGRPELMEVSDVLHGLPADQRGELAGIGRRRAELAPVGALIVIAALEAFERDRITVAEWTLREGMILDAMAGSGWLDAARALA